MKIMKLLKINHQRIPVNLYAEENVFSKDI